MTERMHKTVPCCECEVHGDLEEFKDQLEIYLINCLWEGLQVRERSHSEN